MTIKSEDLVKMLQKMDEVEEKAGRAFSSSSEEDLQAAIEKMRELRAMLYAALAREESAPCPVTYPVIVPHRDVPWWEQDTVTCGSSSNGKTEAI